MDICAIYKYPMMMRMILMNHQTEGIQSSTDPGANVPLIPHDIPSLLMIIIFSQFIYYPAIKGTASLAGWPVCVSPGVF